jgi:hypothetical protein
MSLIRWVKAFAKVNRIRKEKDRVIETSKAFGNAIEFSFDVLIGFTEV